MIKLKDILRRHSLIENANDSPPPVKFVSPPSDHSYSKAAGTSAGKPYTQDNIDFSELSGSEDVNARALNVIKAFENNINNPRGGYNKKTKLWYPHKSLEGGNDTIAYGHKIKNGEDYSKGISDNDAIKLLQRDINDKIAVAKQHLAGFDQFPLSIRIAILNGLFRGDLGPKAIGYLDSHQFGKAAKEYLNHAEYRATNNKGIKNRMEWNAKVFKNAA